MVSVTEVTMIGSKPILGLFALTTDTIPVASADGTPAVIEGFPLYNGSSVLLDDGTFKKYDQQNNIWIEY